MESLKAFAASALALAGAAFCGLNVAGWHLPCATQGCEVYTGFTLFGFSLYAWGVAGFASLALAAMSLGATGRGGFYGLLLAGALLTDTACLFYQSLFWPCASCLFVASLLGAIVLLSIGLFPRFRRRFLVGLTCLWAVFFMNVGISLAREALLRPWALSGEPGARVEVYFSPTCPACREVVEKILQSPGREEAAFYPVDKNPEDRSRLQNVLDEGLSGERALYRLFEGRTPPRKGAGFGLRIKLFQNRAVLAAHGIQRVPAIIASSVPQSYGPPVTGTGVQSLGSSPASVEPFTDGCSMAAEETCK